MTAAEDERPNDFGQSRDEQADVEPALDPGEADGVFDLSFQEVYGSTLPASANTGVG